MLRLVLLLLPVAFGQNELDIKKGPIVYLFEWKWNDIARECEEFLAPHGIFAVQTSPPHENLVVDGRSWTERFQVVSYKLISRSGTEEELASMLKRCNQVGVRVFAHAVINHMTNDTDKCVGVGGSTCNPQERDYPAVPYTKDDFNPPCLLENLTNATEVRECELLGYHDLNQKKENVRNRITAYLNHLIDIGFSGFRVDSAMNMYPSDLAEIYRKVNNLNSKLGLPENTRPFIYQDVYDFVSGAGLVSYKDYAPLGLITDILYNVKITWIIKKKKPFSNLKYFGKTDSGFVPDDRSIVSVDAYEWRKQRNYNLSVTYKHPSSYKIGIAFMLAWGHGYPLILSGYKFEHIREGPPADDKDNILSPDPDKNNVCKNGWICQHRWKQIYSMVEFNRITQGTKVTTWWDNKGWQMAFSRGDVGFVAFNMDDKPLKMSLKTNLPAGKYCDMVSGGIVNGKCKGRTVEVGSDSSAEIDLKAFNELDLEYDGFLAICNHASSRLGGPSSVTMGGPVSVTNELSTGSNKPIDESNLELIIVKIPRH